MGCVLHKLEEKKLLDNTLVIITGDHGQEFNENHKNYWGHGSNYSPVQTHIPSYYMNRENSHIPTITVPRTMILHQLMNKVLGVTNPPSDYSMGHLITDTCPRNWHIVGDNLNYAFIVENHTILEKHPSGYIEISDSALNPLENYKIDNRKLNEAILSLNRFYK